MKTPANPIIAGVALILLGALAVAFSESTFESKYKAQLAEVSDEVLVDFLYEKIMDRFGPDWEQRPDTLRMMNDAQISLYYVNSFQIGFLWDGLDLTFKNMGRDMRGVVFGLQFFDAPEMIKILNAAAHSGRAPTAAIANIASRYEKECKDQMDTNEDWYGCLYSHERSNDLVSKQITYIRSNPEAFIELLK